MTFWLLVALTVVLLPAWLQGEMAYPEVNGKVGLEFIIAVLRAIFTPYLRAMLNPWLPVAFGLLLSVWAGGVNLSVWGCMALGAAVGWIITEAGLSDQAALAAGTAAGGCVGVATGAVWWRLKGPVWLTSAAAGFLAMFVSRSLIATRQTAVGGPHAELSHLSGGMAMTLALYVFAVVGVGIIHRFVLARGSKAADPRTWLVLALCAGGALSAAAGCAMIMASGRMPHSGWVFGDLRVLAAVVLAGGWVWRGRGGFSAACMLLPVGMLVATMWMDTIGVWLPGIRGTAPLLMLVVLAGGFQIVTGDRGRRRARPLAGVMTSLGVVIVAVGAYWPIGEASRYLAVLGMIAWLIGMGAGLKRLHDQHGHRLRRESV